MPTETVTLTDVEAALLDEVAAQKSAVAETTITRADLIQAEVAAKLQDMQRDSFNVRWNALTDAQKLVALTAGEAA
tara:strand:- start:6915 stop:7142 length:228 start_codon:yes stop_codon:yes gene_type:complete